MSQQLVSSTHVLHQQGFHLTLSTQLSINATDALPECSLQVIYRLPPEIIIDPYELIDHGFQSFQLSDISNLELPLSAVDNTDYILSVEPGVLHADIAIDLPMHVRYGTPTFYQATHKVFDVYSPIPFWYCPRSSSPVLSDLDWHSSWTVQIPVGSIADLLHVEMATAIVILLSFLYLLQKAMATAHTLRSKHLKSR